MSNRIPGRAETPEHKRNLMEQILSYWMAHPQLRLGQLIQNAVDVRGSNLFYVEDEELIKLLQAYTEKFGG